MSGKSVLDTPEWARHCRRFHALSRINSAIGRELTRKSDPEFRGWLQELVKLERELLERDQRQFERFAEEFAAGAPGPGADELGEAGAIPAKGGRPDGIAVAAPPSGIQAGGAL